MKIPLMTIVVAIFLSACNPAKPDTGATTRSVAIVRSDPEPVVISAQSNIRAFVYVAGDAAKVRVGDKPEQRLTGINPALYPDYSPVMFKVHDLNRDGLSEIAVLASVSFGAVDLCYDVFHYNPATGKFTRKPENFYCTHG